MWGWNWLENLLQDIRYGLRQSRRIPGFTTVAVLTLALGIGANTAIFTLVDAVMLKSLPVASPSQLYRLGDNNNRGIEVGTQNGGSLFSILIPYTKPFATTRLNLDSSPLSSLTCRT